MAKRGRKKTRDRDLPDPLLSGKQLPDFPEPPPFRESDELDKLVKKREKEADKDLAFGGKHF